MTMMMGKGCAAWRAAVLCRVLALAAIALSAALSGEASASGVLGEGGVAARSGVEAVDPDLAWTVAQAMAPRARPLLDMTRAGQSGAAVVTALQAAASDPQLDGVQRDALLFEYLAGLRELSQAQVPAAVLDWLVDYQPQAWSRHPESATALVPTFAIAAAADGLRNQWRYDSARAAVLASADPAALVALWQGQGDGPEREGVWAALSALPRKRLLALAVQVDALRAEATARAGDRVPERSERAIDSDLAGLALAARVLAGEGVGMAEVLVDAEPRVIARLLVESERRMPAEVGVQVARAALRHPDPGTRGLALTAVGRAMVRMPGRASEWRDELLGLLGDAEIGSAAALHLARLLDDAEVEALARSVADDPQRRRQVQLIQRLRLDSMVMEGQP